MSTHYTLFCFFNKYIIIVTFFWNFISVYNFRRDYRINFIRYQSAQLTTINLVFYKTHFDIKEMYLFILKSNNFYLCNIYVY